MKNLHTFEEFLNESINEGRLMPTGYNPSSDVKDGPVICKSIINKINNKK